MLEFRRFKGKEGKITFSKELIYLLSRILSSNDIEEIFQEAYEEKVFSKEILEELKIKFLEIIFIDFSEEEKRIIKTNKLKDKLIGLSS